LTGTYRLKFSVSSRSGASTARRLGRRIEGTPAPGFFCFLDEMSDGGEPAYRDLVFLSELGDPEKPESFRLREHLPLPLGAGSLDMAMSVVKERSVKLLSEYIAEAAGTTDLQEAAEDVVRMHADKESTSEPELLKPLIAYILYLCTENAEIVDPTGKRQQPGNPQATKVKGGMRQFPIDRVTRWDVAFRLGAALRRGGREASESKGVRIRRHGLTFARRTGTISGRAREREGLGCSR
jgi:hypothetical protein